MYFILVTVSLISLLLHPGLGQLPEPCPADSSGGEGTGVSLQLNCTTSSIEVNYTRVGRAETDDILSILYTCQHPNGTQIFENDQVLVEGTNSQIGTESIPDIDWIEHGLVCNFYACYTSYIFPFDLIKSKTEPVTCNVVDIETCTKDCNSRGADACQTGTGDSLPLGYGCICGDGYVWNATHCENVDECNTTDPDHQHNCSTDEGYRCLDLEGSFLCVRCTDEEEWNGTSCILLPTNNSNVSTTVIVESTEAPTTYDTTSAEVVITNTNTPTTYSDSMSTEEVTTNANAPPTTYTLLPEVVASNVVPAAVGVLCFLLVLIGLLIGFFVIVLYLYSKKTGDKSVYTEMSYYPGYPRYPHYVEEIDMNFEPIDSIHPPSVGHLSSSLKSNLNRLWEEPDTYTCTTLHHTSASRPHHLHPSRLERSGIDRRGPSVDNCIDQSTGEAEQSMNSADSLSSMEQEMRDHPLRRDLNDFSDVLPTDLEKSTITPQQHRCSCVVMECAAGSIRQTNSGHYRQSSVSTLESERMHFDLTGSGFTDTSGYITCISRRDHLEELEQT